MGKLGKFTQRALPLIIMVGQNSQRTVSYVRNKEVIQIAENGSIGGRVTFAPSGKEFGSFLLGVNI